MRESESFLALVVDDNEINRIICEELLLEFNISSVLAESGEQALAAFADNEFDIVFVDHVMPVMDGVELCRRIRAMGGRQANLPIAALTGNDVERYKLTYIDAGMNGWLTKPVDYDEMAGLLSELIGITVKEDNKSASPGIDKKLLRAFVIQVKDKLPLMNGYLNEGRLADYAIEAHSLKSSLINVGKPELSELARELELLSGKGELELVREKDPAFTDAVRDYAKTVSERLEQENAGVVRPEGNMGELCNKLESAKNAFDEFEVSDAADIIRGLARCAYGQYDSQLAELDAMFETYAFDRIGGALSGLILSVKYARGG